MQIVFSLIVGVNIDVFPFICSIVCPPPPKVHHTAGPFLFSFFLDRPEYLGGGKAYLCMCSC